ncbi:conserved unknown protein [Ectocarpus siliculosus]|uniref:Uncharacterized protein n=1 Tax=Ectocarpus siliculosus TaxID=2880 RepID=D8LSE8_ECTSI|nr:conserved unknown protein [Ectocarpus siliculosus]|eukprot:CBN75205.1 conserved unknown protein [Ectocarpus siliculosus]
MPSKKKSAPRGAGPGARPAAADPGIDIVFDKPKPKARGHRQRGAGTVMVDRGGVERDGVTVLSWQRLPSQLVQQHADRLQMKRPHFHPVQPSEPGLFRFRVVLPDRKNNAKDMAFCPTESFHTAAQGKEHAALLALLKLQGDQPLERKLPEPYKWEKAKKAREDKAKEEKEKQKAEAKPTLGDSLWGSSVEKEEEQKKKNEAIRRAAEGPAAVVLKADTKFVSRFEADKARADKEKVVKDRKRKAEARARSNTDMKVMMSARLRKILEEALGLTEERERQRDGGAEHHGLTLDGLEGTDRAALEKVQGMGFPADDVLRAVDACPGEEGETLGQRADALLEWLCLHLEEAELPKGFDPRGRNLDVIRPGQDFGVAAAIAGASTDEEENGSDSLDAGLLRPLKILAGGLVPASARKQGGGGGGGGGAAGLDAELMTEEEGREAVDEEVMSLEAIYDGAVAVAPNMPEGAYLLSFDLTNLASLPTKAWLDVWVPQAGGVGGYPSEAPPVALVRGPDLLAAGLLHAAQVALARRAKSLIGNPAVYDILMWALDELPAMLALPATGRAARRKEAAAAAAISASVGYGSPGVSVAAAGGGGGGNSAKGGGEGGVDRSVRPRLPGTEPLWSGGASSLGGGSGGRDRGGGGGRGGGRGGVRQQQQRGRGSGGGGLPPGERKRGREKVEASREFESRRRQRAALPAAKAKAEFLSLARRSQVVLVSGETGCGKTTQIPQFLLEEWEEGGGPGGGPDDLRVLVTQPRRIAAVGVAQRVADERCERLGAGVGYKIRGESKAGPDTRLLFCTTGLLLRRMQGDPRLEELTHLVVDEVHERHLDADFLLALLIGILPKRPKLKVILMSATLDTARFAAYFGGLPGLPGGKTPVLHIPGRTFPVRDLYLEDAIAATGHRPRLKRKQASATPGTTGGGGDSPAAAPSAKPHEKSGGGAGRPGGLQGPNHWLQEFEEEDNNKEDLPQRERERGALGGLDMDRVDKDHLHYKLLVSLVLYAVSPQGERELGLRGGEEEDDGGDRGVSGSVLVFMPGTMEIDRLCRELEHATEGGQGLFVLPLHGSLPPQRQRAVFDPPPRGKRKVVVSTNIAETSITIPDATVVLDSCRVKEMGYDVARQMPRLQESWASQDSLTQRKGRAGRVREGVSFKLLRRKTFARLPAHGTPEIKRVPLDHLVLQIKALGVEEHPSVVLARALDPPDPKAVQDAVDVLTDLKALGEGAELTPLGWHLAALPCPVQVGKMLIYGAVLGCLSPLLSIAAGLSCRSPFLSSGDPEKREAIDAAKKRMAAAGGGRSNHTLLAALAGIGFIASSRAAFDPRASVNAQARSWRAVKAAVCAGLYPRVMRVRRPMEKFVDLVGVGAVPVRHTAKEFQFFTRSRGPDSGPGKDDRVFIHPSSINFRTNDWSCPWLVYHERVHTSRVFVRDCTEVSPYALLLFGGQVAVQAGLGRIAVDEWVRFEAVGRIAALVNRLRQRLDGMLWEKIQDPRLDVAGSKLSEALVELLQTDGMG